MYEIDHRDRVRKLHDLPPSSAGAPLPCVLADEHRVAVYYYIAESDSSWKERIGRDIPVNAIGEPIAIVVFSLCYVHTFGPPNDEAFAGHPLASCGLHPYGAFEIESSSWVRRLEKMNSVHPYHEPERFRRRRHIVLSFHDSTFECVCDGFKVAVTFGSSVSVLREVATLLEWDAG